MSPFSDLIQHSAGWLFIPSAIFLGALHGLEPGHSKTMMAAFIVAIRGSIAQAALLAIAATISHTAIVWIVAILALTYGSQWSAETSEPYFQLASAAIILGIAAWMLVRTFRDQRAVKASAAHDHGHTHDETKIMDTGHGLAVLSIFEDGVPPRFRLHFTDRNGRVLPLSAENLTVETTREGGLHQTFTFASKGDFLEAIDVLPEPHQFLASLSIVHGGHVHKHEVQFTEHRHEGLDVSDKSYQSAHERAHAAEWRARFANGNVTTLQIVLFGLTGGLLPCSAAITVLLLCLQLQKFWLGIVLVMCFSIGLAITLLAAGVLAAWSVRHASRRWSGFDAFARRAPYLSSLLIIAIGLFMVFEGLSRLEI